MHCHRNSLDEPDDVGRQGGHLLGRERHAGDQVPLPGQRHAGVHQSRVLRLVVGVTVEETAAGDPTALTFRKRAINLRLRNRLPNDQIRADVSLSSKSAHHTHASLRFGVS